MSALGVGDHTLEGLNLMNLQQTKIQIHRRLEASRPEVAAMFLKNWKRYDACIRFMEKSGALRKEYRILDYGCGHPIISAILIELGYRVVPYEPYAGESEFDTAKALGIEQQLCTSVAEANHFDLILMIDVIEHLAVIKPVMEDVKSKVKPGGLLFISTPNVLRVEMWLSFVLRQTGHPQPLMHYLESNDHFTHHQREFTLKELRVTLKHFGFNTILDDCQDTRPSINELNALRVAQGKSAIVKSERGSILRSAIYGVLKEVFPKKMNNNLLFLAKRVK